MPTETYQSYVDRIALLFEERDHTEAIDEINKDFIQTASALLKHITPDCIATDLARTGQVPPNLFSGQQEIFLSSNDEDPTTVFNTIHTEYKKRLRILHNHIYSTQANLKNLTQNTVQFSNLDVNIRDEFETLNNIAPFTMFDNRPMWKLPEFTLAHSNTPEIKFGGLYLYFSFGAQGIRSGLRIYPDKDVATYETRDHAYFHPHIDRDGGICTGEGEAGLKRLWEQKRLSAIATMLISLLSTYNERSPFRTLDSFKQVKRYDCENCGESVTENHVKFVNDDQNLPACQSCAIVKNQRADGSPEIVWKNDYVRSNYHHNVWIAKSNATKVLGANGDWDYVENVLSHQDFQSCPKCFCMVHVKQTVDTSDGIICKLCDKKLMEGAVNGANNTATHIV